MFDVYRDPERIGAGQVSLALRLSFRAADRTLTDEEVAGRRRAITAALSEKLGGPGPRCLSRPSPSSGRPATPGRSARACSIAIPHFALAASPHARTWDGAWTTSTRTIALPASSRSSTSTAMPMSTRRSSPIPTAPPPSSSQRWSQRGVRVVDSQADFRLRDPAVYAEWYREHPAPELLDGAVYGLPERYREQIAGASIVANPGCYPTATLLALAPLAAAGAIGEVIVDAKSGVSGAGRAATEKTHFVTVDENVSAYGVPRHRHTPEIEQELAALGADVRITFTPHLLPLDQGELVSCYVTPAGAPLDGEAAHALYAEHYAGEPFVEITDRPPGVRDVRETNLCRISVHADERTGRLVIFGVIDNLWKGAASQAVQNLNLMFGRPEGEGIS